MFSEDKIITKESVGGGKKVSRYLSKGGSKLSCEVGLLMASFERERGG
jgi:hypothetical protein